MGSMEQRDWLALYSINHTWSRLQWRLGKTRLDTPPFEQLQNWHFSPFKTRTGT